MLLLFYVLIDIHFCYSYYESYYKAIRFQRTKTVYKVTFLIPFLPFPHPRKKKGEHSLLMFLNAETNSEFTLVFNEHFFSNIAAYSFLKYMHKYLVYFSLCTFLLKDFFFSFFRVEFLNILLIEK